MATHDASDGPTVLVVDDEALLRMHAADLLEQEGFQVVEAADAAAALKVLEARPDVRLLFTDVQMPGALDGMDLAREVHARWPHILLVITSARKKPDPDDIPDDGRFVAKPYSTSDLMVEVNDLVGKRDGD